jgi:hypothetical protein
MSAAPSAAPEADTSAAATADTGLSENSLTEDWALALISKFPTSTCRFFTADKRVISLVFNATDEEAISNTLKDMSLKFCTSRDKNGKSALRQFGEVPKGAFGTKQHHKQKFVPPPSSVAYLSCMKRDIHPSHQPTSERASYVDKQGAGCSLGCAMRKFADHGKILLTFHYQAHEHTCTTFNDHLLPLRKGEMTFIVLGLIKYETAKVFYEKAFGPMVVSRQEKKVRRSRFDVLTLPELERTARKLGLSTVARQGVEDIEQVRLFLLARQAEGDTVIFKPPGLSVDHPSVILHEDARPYVKTADCLFLVMSKVQREVLAALGIMVATDGTHAIFSYTNVKIIAVTVTSFKPGTKLRERGFPVALAMTNSEREDIQRAVVITLRRAVPEWKPKLLMTDMAFSAFNAWSAEFPDLVWLWCVFHVWQAWIRRLKNVSNPGGFSKAEWSEIKGHLIRAVKDAICPKVKDITMEQWVQTCSNVSKLLWFCGVVEIAECWDLYVTRADRWALPKRWEAIRRLFGDLDELPMLARSNNVTEAFFNVLKYHILDGKSLKTFIQFLTIWTAYAPRLLSNLARANVLHFLETSADAPAALAADEEMEALEEDLERDEDDLIAGVGEAVDEAPEGEEDLSLIYAQSAEASLRNKQDQLREEFEKLKAMFDAFLPPADAPPLAAEITDSLLRQVRGSISLIEAVNHGASHGLPLAPPSQPFIRQEFNYDSTSFETAKARLEAEMNLGPPAQPRAPHRVALTAPSAEAACVSASSQSGSVAGSLAAPPAAGNTPAADLSDLKNADMSSLHKQKKVKLGGNEGDINVAALPEIPFTTFVGKLLVNAAAEAKIKEAQHQAKGSGMPALRAALAMNTKVRIFSVFKAILREDLPNKTKAEMIAIALGRLASKVQLTPDIAAELADLGLVHTASDTLQAGELVLLRSNSIASTGEACVAACQNICGWVVRDTVPIFCDYIDTCIIYWGRLVERRKVPTML